MSTRRRAVSSSQTRPSPPTTWPAPAHLRTGIRRYDPSSRGRPPETPRCPGVDAGRRRVAQVLGALASRPNVLVTPHMAFLTADALEAIAEVTAENLAEFVASRHDPSLTFTNQVLP
mmetsp:Transcript_29378/g.95433  ORF Transcript_29378/g.95433 Transcript_29378/m.95433 type:complete len:117 (+) Transcript_29378:923-1273(+)